jgi:hypothetical protein
LRSAKLAFLHSGSGLAHPRYWGAFVLTGSGLSPLPTVVPWSLVLLAGAAVFTVIALAARFAIRAGKRSPRREAGLIGTHPL